MLSLSQLPLIDLLLHRHRQTMMIPVHVLCSNGVGCYVVLLLSHVSSKLLLTLKLGSNIAARRIVGLRMANVLLRLFNIITIDLKRCSLLLQLMAFHLRRLSCGLVYKRVFQVLILLQLALVPHQFPVNALLPFVQQLCERGDLKAEGPWLACVKRLFRLFWLHLILSISGI